MKFTLRDYQNDAARAVAVGFERPVAGEGPFDTQLAVLATGAGKTIVAVALTDFWRSSRAGRVLFLADTDELVQQAVDKYVDAAGIIPGVEKAQQRAPEGADTVVASIQTLSRPDRLAGFPADRFTHVIADEAHLSMADSWQRVLGHFRSGGAKILGITATPERADGKALGEFYENVAIEVGIFDLIERQYLAPVRVITCPVEIDATGVDGSGEDLDPDDLAEVLEPYLEAVIDEWEQHCRDRKSLFFHPSIALSKKFTELLQRRGIAADHVDGTSPDRRERIQAFCDGRTKVMNNVQLLTKGFDCPDISCVTVLRPTRSRVAFQQMIGRGTRIADGKHDCVVLDFLWQFEDLGVQRPASLLARSDEEAEFMQRRIDRQAREGDTTPLDLRETQSATEAEKINLLLDRFRSAVQGGRRAFDYRELGAMLYQPDLIEYEPQGGWELAQPTERQREMLRKRGVSLRSIKSRGVASKVIEAIIDRTDKGLATPRQIRTLLGFEIDPERAAAMTFDEASEELDRLLGGGGKRQLGKPEQEAAS